MMPLNRYCGLQGLFSSAQCAGGSYARQNGGVGVQDIVHSSVNESLWIDSPERRYDGPFITHKPPSDPAKELSSFCKLNVSPNDETTSRCRLPNISWDFTGDDFKTKPRFVPDHRSAGGSYARQNDGAGVQEMAHSSANEGLRIANPEQRYDGPLITDKPPPPPYPENERSSFCKLNVSPYDETRSRCLLPNTSWHFTGDHIKTKRRFVPDHQSAAASYKRQNDSADVQEIAHSGIKEGVRMSCSSENYAEPLITGEPPPPPLYPKNEGNNFYKLRVPPTRRNPSPIVWGDDDIPTEPFSVLDKEQSAAASYRRQNDSVDIQEIARSGIKEDVQMSCSAQNYDRPLITCGPPPYPKNEGNNFYEVRVPQTRRSPSPVVVDEDDIPTEPFSMLDKEPDIIRCTRRSDSGGVQIIRPYNLNEDMDLSSPARNCDGYLNSDKPLPPPYPKNDEKKFLKVDVSPADADLGILSRVQITFLTSSGEIKTESYCIPDTEADIAEGAIRNICTSGARRNYSLNGGTDISNPSSNSDGHLNPYKPPLPLYLENKGDNFDKSDILPTPAATHSDRMSYKRYQDFFQLNSGGTPDITDRKRRKVCAGVTETAVNNRDESVNILDPAGKYDRERIPLPSSPSPFYPKNADSNFAKVGKVPAAATTNSTRLCRLRTLWKLSGTGIKIEQRFDNEVSHSTYQPEESPELVITPVIFKKMEEVLLAGGWISNNNRK